MYAIANRCSVLCHSRLFHRGDFRSETPSVPLLLSLLRSSLVFAYKTLPASCRSPGHRRPRVSFRQHPLSESPVTNLRSCACIHCLMLALRMLGCRSTVNNTARAGYRLGQDILRRCYKSVLYAPCRSQCNASLLRLRHVAIASASYALPRGSCAAAMWSSIRSQCAAFGFRNVQITFIPMRSLPVCSHNCGGYNSALDTNIELNRHCWISANEHLPHRARQSSLPVNS